jgi:flagellar biosynthesis/type III secretory pathway M-ring protein FliF/YscJ
MFNVNKFQLSGNPWTLFGIYLIFSSVLTALVLVFAVVRPLWKRRTERRQKRRQTEEKRKILRKIWTEDLDGIALTSMGSSVDS